MKTITGQLPDAAADVLAERKRQIEVEGFDIAHDDESHAPGNLSLAALCYIDNAADALIAGRESSRDDRVDAIAWPWHVSWWKPTTPRRDLVKAAALIIAEIERIDRQAGTQ